MVSPSTSCESLSDTFEKYETILEPINISYENLLSGRPLWNCFIEEPETKQWIRCPTEKTLRALLSFMIIEQLEINIVFRENKASPNQSPPYSTPNEPFEISSQKSPVSQQISVDKDLESLNLNSNGTLPVVNTFDLGTTKFMENDTKPINATDPFTKTLVSEMVSEILLKLPCDDGVNIIAVDAGFLFQYINSQVYNAVHPFDITVDFIEKDINYRVTLTKAIWLNYLTRNHSNSSIYIGFLAEGYGQLFKLDAELKKLHASPELWMKIKIFHYDLMHFGSNNLSESRLSLNPDMPFFMNRIYFNDFEREYILSFPTSSGITCGQYYRQMQLLKIQEQGNQAVICASHDLAPAMAKIFNIQKGYEQEKNFKVL